MPWACLRCGAGFEDRPVLCPGCGSEELLDTARALQKKRAAPADCYLDDVPAHDDAQRLHTGFENLDRVLGGGLVDDSLVLLDGAPGEGKSTLLLQVLGNLALAGAKVLYATGEEGLAAIKARALRVGLDPSGLSFRVTRATNLSVVEPLVRAFDADVLVVDSAHVFTTLQGEGPAASVSMLHALALHCSHIAKDTGCAVVLIGQVNAQGDVAGPMALPHAVDAHLHFGSVGGTRFLVAEKNRYGVAGETGYFEMTGRGLTPAPDPSLVLLHRTVPEPGMVFLPDAKRAKPTLVRVEALSSEVPLGGTFRARGVHENAVRDALAVLRHRCGVDCLKGRELAVEVGKVLGEPCKDEGLDLALVCAILSAHIERPMPWPPVVFGTVSVRGRVEQVPRDHPRLEACVGWGVTTPVLAPAYTPEVEGVSVTRLANVAGVLHWLQGRRRQNKEPRTR